MPAVKSELIGWMVVEKANHLHVHMHSHSPESAQRWIDVNAVDYCARGLFTDKTLTPASFEVVPRYRRTPR